MSTVTLGARKWFRKQNDNDDIAIGTWDIRIPEKKFDDDGSLFSQYTSTEDPIVNIDLSVSFGRASGMEIIDSSAVAAQERIIYLNENHLLFDGFDPYSDDPMKGMTGEAAKAVQKLLTIPRERYKFNYIGNENYLDEDGKYKINVDL